MCSVTNATLVAIDFSKRNVEDGVEDNPLGLGLKKNCCFFNKLYILKLLFQMIVKFILHLPNYHV